MEFTPTQIRAFRYWIQGYQNFYEPIVEEYFKVAGYHVLAHPAQVTRADIERVRSALFDGRRKVSPGLEAKKSSKSSRSEHGASPLPAIMAAANVCSSGTARNAVYSLIPLSMVHRTNPEAPRAEPAIYDLVNRDDDELVSCITPI